MVVETCGKFLRVEGIMEEGTEGKAKAFKCSNGTVVNASMVIRMRPVIQIRLGALRGISVEVSFFVLEVDNDNLI